MVARPIDPVCRGSLSSLTPGCGSVLNPTPSPGDPSGMQFLGGALGPPLAREHGIYQNVGVTPNSR